MKRDESQTRGETLWKMGDIQVDFSEKIWIMGILNVTPDSFSDGGQFDQVESAVRQGLDMVRGGADVLDVGGESTRPGATPVSVEEEIRRVIPVIKELVREVTVPISVDTMKVEVAEAAWKAGAMIVNDVAAGKEGRGMEVFLKRSGMGYVAMHMKGEPGTMQADPQYENVVTEVHEFLQRQVKRLKGFGIEEERVVLDVGIGFGKRLEHNLLLMKKLKEFSSLRRPLLMGVSRKRWIGEIAGGMAGERLGGSLAGALWAIEHGAKIVRVHDVAETCQAVKIWETLKKKDF